MLALTASPSFRKPIAAADVSHDSLRPSARVEKPADTSAGGGPIYRVASVMAGAYFDGRLEDLSVPYHQKWKRRWKGYPARSWHMDVTENARPLRPALLFRTRKPRRGADQHARTEVEYSSQQFFGGGFVRFMTFLARGFSGSGRRRITQQAIQGRYTSEREKPIECQVSPTPVPDATLFEVWHSRREIDRDRVLLATEMKVKG